MDCASISRPSRRPLNCTARPISVATTAGAPMISTASPPSARQVVEPPGHDLRRALGGARDAHIPTRRWRGSRAVACQLPRVERTNQHAHVADVGVDRDAHQLRIGKRRRIGLVADVGLRVVARLRRLRAVLLVGMAVVAERREPIALARSTPPPPLRHRRPHRPPCSTSAAAPLPGTELERRRLDDLFRRRVLRRLVQLAQPGDVDGAERAVVSDGALRILVDEVAAVERRSIPRDARRAVRWCPARRRSDACGPAARRRPASVSFSSQSMASGMRARNFVSPVSR